MGKRHRSFTFRPNPRFYPICPRCWRRTHFSRHGLNFVTALAKQNFPADECCRKKVEVKLCVGQIYFLLANPTPTWPRPAPCPRSLNIQSLSHYQTRGASVNQSGPTLMDPTLPGWIRRRPLVALLVQRGGRGRVLVFSLYPDCAVT